MKIRPATQALFAAAAIAAAGCSSASEEDVAATPAPAVSAELDTAAVARDTVAYEARRDTAAPPIQARVEADPEVTTDTSVRAQADISVDANAEADTSANAAITADAGAGMTSHTFDLTGLNNSTAAGQVTVREVGEQEVEVAISLSGGEANAQRTAAVYRGTCENPGTTVEALQDVGAGMGAQSTTTLQIPLTQLLAGDHVVIVREDAMGQSNAIACAELMQQQ